MVTRPAYRHIVSKLNAYVLATYSETCEGDCTKRKKKTIKNLNLKDGKGRTFPGLPKFNSPRGLTNKQIEVHGLRETGHLRVSSRPLYREFSQSEAG